jgi:hypothetical protein
MLLLTLGFQIALAAHELSRAILAVPLPNRKLASLRVFASTTWQSVDLS